MAAKNLTDTAVKNMKHEPGAKSAKAHKDGKTAGLYLMVQPTGAKSWVYQYRRPIDQRQAKMILGSYPAFSLDDAREWAEEQEKARKRGVDPREEKERLAAEAKAAEEAAKAKEEAQAQRDMQTLDWFWKEYYRPECVDTLKRPVNEIRYYEKYLKPAVGHLPLTQIDHAKLEAILDTAKLKSPDLAYKLCGFMRTIWKRMCSIYRSKVVNKEDTARYLFTKNVGGVVERDLNERELGYVISVIDRYCMGNSRNNHRTFALGARLILATGCRLVEGFGARWDQFNLEEGSWLQPGPTTKNGKPNYLLLQEPIVAWLKAMRKEVPIAVHLFRQVKDDKPLNAFLKSTKLLFRETEALAKADGFDMLGWSIHDFRRTITTTFQRLHHPGTLNRIVPLEVSEAVLNHVERSTTIGSRKSYNKYHYAQEKAHALRVWQGFLDKAKIAENTRARDRVAVFPVSRTTKARKKPKSA